MGRIAPAFGDVIGDTVADALNALYRDAQFLERVGRFLKSLGDLAPPCAALPYAEERDKLIALAGELRRTILPSVDPAIRDVVTKALDELLTALRSTPVITQAWTDAPEQWKAGAYELSRRVPTTGFGWVAGNEGMNWSDVRGVGEGLASIGSIALLLTLGPEGAVVAGVLLADRGGGFMETFDRFIHLRYGDVADDLKTVLEATIAEVVRFETRFKPSIYQQVLGVWLLTEASATPEIMKAAMASMNPYTLPAMPDTWDGSFAHMRQESGGESANWLIALLLGAFLGLGAAALSTE